MYMFQKTCSRCKLVKESNDFHNRTISPDGKDGQCKVCRSRTTYQNTDFKDAPDRNRIPAEKILIKFGYELNNPDNPVHLQFNKRIELKYGVILDGIEKGS